MPLTDFQRELCESSPFDFSDLRALYVNCTLRPSPELSHTQGLVDVSVAIMEANGVAVDQFGAIDYDLAPGVYPDMCEHGAASDEWPENDFTNRNTTFMTWNLLHLARLLKDAGGVPAHGNQRSLWEAGCRFEFANPGNR